LTPPPLLQEELKRLTFAEQTFEKEHFMEPLTLFNEGAETTKITDDDTLLHLLKKSSAELDLRCSFPLKVKRFETSPDKSAKQAFEDFYRNSCESETVTAHIFLAFDCDSGDPFQLEDLDDDLEAGKIAAIIVKASGLKSLKDSHFKNFEGSICIPLQFNRFNELGKPWTPAERVGVLTSLEQTLSKEGLSPEFQKEFKSCLKEPREGSVIFKGIKEIVVMDCCSWEELEMDKGNASHEVNRCLFCPHLSPARVLHPRPPSLSLSPPPPLSRTPSPLSPSSRILPPHSPSSKSLQHHHYLVNVFGQSV
jgi:hypothetical protein